MIIELSSPTHSIGPSPSIHHITSGRTLGQNLAQEWNQPIQTCINSPFSGKQLDEMTAVWPSDGLNPGHSD